MRFRFYSTAVAFGGGERYLALLLPELRVRGHECELILVRDRAPRELQALVDGTAPTDGERIHVLNGSGTLYRWWWRVPRRAAAVMVHHSSLQDDQGGVVKRLLRPALLRLMLRRVDAVVRVCRSSIPDGFTSRPIVTVHNGVAPIAGVEPTARASDERFIVAMVGTVNDNKNQRGAIDVLAQLPDRFHLKVIGDGPLLVALKEYAVSRGVAGRIDWVGFVRNPAAELRGCHASLLLSRNEALPFAALESMTMCVPLVSFRVGGLPELITDRHDGVLVDQGDSAAVVRSLLDLAADEGYRSSLARNAAVTIRDRFNLDGMAEKFLQVAQGLLAGADRYK